MISSPHLIPYHLSMSYAHTVFSCCYFSARISCCDCVVVKSRAADDNGDDLERIQENEEAEEKNYLRMTMAFTICTNTHLYTHTYYVELKKKEEKKNPSRFAPLPRCVNELP